MSDYKACHFGEHLMLDCYGGDSEKLNNKDLVTLSLTELPFKLGMRKLIEPLIVEASDNGIKDPGGWSGFVIIAESHISIHTFPKRKFASIDVYSCKNGLDREFIKKYFKEAFEIEEIEEHFEKRGVKYPNHNVC